MTDDGPRARIAATARDDRIVRLAALASALWLGLSALYVVWLRTDSGVTLALVLVIVLPLVLIWLLAHGLRTIAALRAETAQLRATIDSLQRSYLTQVPTAQRSPPSPAPQRPDERPAPASFVSRRESPRPAATPAATPAAPPTAAPADAQGALALGPDSTPDSLPEPVAAADLIRALDFPDSPEDHAGIEALRRALADRNLTRLIRAAQDVLTLLAQDGIFMDDLPPDRAHPDLWRRFAAGERGRTIAALGGIRDRSSLTLSAGRMRSDTIFRDAAHHFLRQFDRSFAAFEKTATDAEIAGFTETRTARAFMLLGRVSGTFD